MSDNAIDIITREVVQRVGPDLEKRVQAVVKDVGDRIQEEAQKRIDAAVKDIPQIAIRSAIRTAEQSQTEAGPVDVKADARDRAWRTLVQGFAVTIILAVITAFGTAVTAPEFDLLTWDSWKAAATAAGTAGMISVAAYIQRLIQPPKGS
ncbi:hypothetical protein [Rhodococcus pyridinivorans]|uniref:hypothetical protein n=1 Tax=Rhodococcus pyridinivorans TaxID=103816 RepID=UPI003AAC2890